MGSSSRPNLYLCWEILALCIVALEPPDGRQKKNPWIKSCCSFSSRVRRSFQKHCGVFCGVFLAGSCHHHLTTASLWWGKLQVIAVCEVAALTAAREYCGFSKNGGVFLNVPLSPGKKTPKTKHLQLCMRAKNMWENSLVFIWIGYRGRDKTFEQILFHKTVLMTLK